MTSKDEDTKILERALEACTDEYREAAGVWTTLETKAQVAITVAGVFLAAAFSLSLSAGISLNIKILLAVTLPIPDRWIRRSARDNCSGEWQ